MTREEKFNDYEGFVAKFQTKKTTDDCYTPPAVYEAVKAWACRRYGIDPARTVRPFWPGGDYERFDYPAGAVVLDNPRSEARRVGEQRGRRQAARVQHARDGRSAGQARKDSGEWTQ